MAKAKTTRTESGSAQQANSLSRYFKETRGELRKVTWPTRQESWRLTLIVIGVTIAITIFMTAFDAVFSRLSRILVNLIIGNGLG